MRRERRRGWRRLAPRRAALALAAAVSAAGSPALCAGQEVGASGEAAGRGEGLLELRPLAGLDAYLPTPGGAPLTTASVALGRRLFFESKLSADGSLSCASCHRPDRAFTDSVPVSQGVHGVRGVRNTPTLVNAAWGRAFFWDGRTATLEEQVLRPVQDVREMASHLPEVVAALRADTGYARAFDAAYGAPPSEEMLARALAAYVRTIRAGASRYDLFRSGESGALTAEESAGYRLFVGKAHCATCHVGPTLTDQRFHNTGIAWRDGDPVDAGRYAVTRAPADAGAFKTPTLREVARTAPYMHDGSLRTLEDVLDFYDRGGHPNPYLDADIRPLRLNVEEKRALVAFLRALTGTVAEGEP